jgi:hypothetical protein
MPMRRWQIAWLLALGILVDYFDRVNITVSHAALTSSDSILHPAKFTRDRRVDLCGLCHSGSQRGELTPAFSYRPPNPPADLKRPLKLKWLRKAKDQD